MKDLRKKALESRMRHLRLSGVSTDSKRNALRHFKSMRDKKKLPRVETVRDKNHNSKYNKLSIEEWEKKHL